MLLSGDIFFFCSKAQQMGTKSVEKSVRRSCERWLVESGNGNRGCELISFPLSDCHTGTNEQAANLLS